jgi:hypothetical protein
MYFIPSFSSQYNPWWVGERELNSRSPRPQRGALPLSYHQHYTNLHQSTSNIFKNKKAPMYGGLLPNFHIRTHRTPTEQLVRTIQYVLECGFYFSLFFIFSIIQQKPFFIFYDINKLKIKRCQELFNNIFKKKSRTRIRAQRTFRRRFGR